MTGYKIKGRFATEEQFNQHAAEMRKEITAKKLPAGWHVLIAAKWKNGGRIIGFVCNDKTFEQHAQKLYAAGAITINAVHGR